VLRLSRVLPKAKLSLRWGRSVIVTVKNESRDIDCLQILGEVSLTVRYPVRIFWV
jgi:hypothetical protein